MSQNKENENKFSWSLSSTKYLISLWKENNSQLLGTKKNAPIYQKMANELKKFLNLKEDITITGRCINDKIKKLKQLFR